MGHNAPVRPVRSIAPAAPLVAPAHDGVVGCYGAGVKLANAHALVGRGGCVSLAVLVVSPARNGVVSCNGAGVIIAGANTLVGSTTVPIVSPGAVFSGTVKVNLEALKFGP